ncbi:hypothetical protein V5P93_002308 [Actinokineospora auranticolor]|uniref:hypothetical protein n=1 Tax=Actinokineospora auranticolor TaxID=155976 RepID=UPI0035A8D490
MGIVVWLRQAVAVTPPKVPPAGAGTRQKIQAAIEAALWTLSNGRCYEPHCTAPVVVETRPGVYRKNVQISHIYGVKPDAPRHVKTMSPEERDSFKNLLLLCTPHHADVDDKKTGATDFPPDLLKEWKIKREGVAGPPLAKLRIDDAEKLLDVLTRMFSPPLDRLEAITDRLERTGEVTERTVDELRDVLRTLGANQGVDHQSIRRLALAAEMLEHQNINRAATLLAASVEALPGLISDLDKATRRLPEY